MATLTAANAARLDAILDRPFHTEDVNSTLRQMIEDDLIAYGRIRTRAGKQEYGFILREDAEAAHLSDRHDSYAEALAYTPFYYTPKMLVDYLHDTELIRTLHVNTAEDIYVLS